MNKKKLIVLFVFAFLLSGCKDKVNELYNGNAYASENFIDNYYEIWNEDLINNVSTTINYELTVDNPETPDSEGIVKIDYKQRVAMGINPSLNYIDAVDQINPDTKEYLNWFDDTPVEDKGKGFGPTKNLSTIDKIVLVISGAYLTGFGYSLIHKSNYHVGGFAILDEIVNNYRTKKSKDISLLVDVIVVVLTFLSYGFETAVYSVIAIFLINYMSTKSRIGVSNSKTFFIITTKESEVKDYLINELNHDYTEFNVKGGYSNNKNKIIMTVVDTKDYYRLKEGINLIDPNAFVFIIDNYEAINKNVTISKKLNIN